MNLVKSEMKMALVQELGRQLEQRETHHIAEMHRYEGAIGALSQGLEKLEGVKGFYNKERDEGRLEEADLAVVVKAIDRCRGVLVSLSDVASTQKLIKQGEANEAKHNLDVIEKVFTDEKAKVDAVLRGLEDGTIKADEGAETVRTQSATSRDLAERKAAARAEREAQANLMAHTSASQGHVGQVHAGVTTGSVDPPTSPAVTTGASVIHAPVETTPAPVETTPAPVPAPALEPAAPVFDVVEDKAVVPLEMPEVDPIPTPKRQMVQRRKK